MRTIHRHQRQPSCFVLSTFAMREPLVCLLSIPRASHSDQPPPHQLPTLRTRVLVRVCASFRPQLICRIISCALAHIGAECLYYIYKRVCLLTHTHTHAVFLASLAVARREEIHTRTDKKSQTSSSHCFGGGSSSIIATPSLPSLNLTCCSQFTRTWLRIDVSRALKVR